MNITVIGADRPLGAALAGGLGPEFEVTSIGQTAAEGCRAVDILERDAREAALRDARGGRAPCQRPARQPPAGAELEHLRKGGGARAVRPSRV